MELNSKNIKKILLIVFLSAIIVLAVANVGLILTFIKKIASFFTPIIVALCIAFVLNVLLVPLETKIFKFMDNSKKRVVRKLKRPLCLFITYILAFGIISTVILVIIPDLVETVTYLTDKLPSFVSSAQDFIEKILLNLNIIENDLPEIQINWSSFAKTLTDWLQGSYSRIFGDAVNITASVFSGLFDTMFSIVISGYVLAQKEKIMSFVKRMLNAFLPKRATDILYHISSQTYESFSRFIGGQVLEAFIIGALFLVGMTIFRMPNAVIISVLISVSSLIPIVGPTIGAIVGFLLIVITNPLKAVFFIIFFLILQQIEGNLIYPRVVGRVVGLPGVIVISAVLVGSNIGGVIGALIAVPTSAVIYTFLRELIDYYHSKKETNNIDS